MLFALILLAAGASAQSGTIFSPQVDTYVGLTPNTDVVFLAAGTPGVDGKHPELTLGPNFDVALWPFLTQIKSNNPERSKYLTLRLGYRYNRALDTSKVQNVGVIELTPRFPLPLKMQLADRNRIDLRGLPDRFTWRYRNRLTLLRSFEVHHLDLTPYGEAEFYYDCKTGEWTHYTYSFGGFVRLSAKVEVDSSYKRQIDIVRPFATANIVRLKLLLFFHTVGN